MEKKTGILAVTRSFGDHRMKDYVIGVPYTSTTTCVVSVCRHLCLC